MSFYTDHFCEKNKSFELIGSQINLTPRSDHSLFGSFSSKSCRLSSPASSRSQFRQHSIWPRPKSAECRSMCLNESDSALPRSFHFRENDKCGESSITVSDFTDSSSKLLQQLIDSSDSCTPIALPNADDIFCPCEPENSKESSKRECTENISPLKMSNTKDGNVEEQLSKSLKGFKFQELFPEFTEEKTVRFLENPKWGKELSEKNLNHNEMGHKWPHPRAEEMLYTRSKSELLLSCQRNFPCQRKRKTSDPEKFVELETRKTAKTNDGSILQCTPAINTNEILQRCGEQLLSTKEKKTEDTHNTFSLNLVGSEEVGHFQSKLEEFSDDGKHSENCEISALEKSSPEGGVQIDVKPSVVEQIIEGTDSNKKNNFSDSTYEEIVQLLQALEEEDSDSLNERRKEESATEVLREGKASPEGITNYFDPVSSYLEEVELLDTSPFEHYANGENGFSSPRLEELLNKNSVELAHQVFSLKIQIEDQKKGIKLLKDTLEEMKEAKKAMEIGHKEALQKVNSEAEILLERHQKFIKQLLNEKNNLNETVSKLVQDLKSGEEKYKRNMKVIEEKHVIEIKRAKEAQAVADKIKREKWMEMKSEKIKVNFPREEMTVKGLEPELSRMAARQQEEMAELRSLHKAEIEAIELRAARRTSDLMDELRVELTKEKERLVAREIASARASMEIEFEKERNKLEKCCQAVKENLRKEEEKLSNQEEEFKEKLLNCKLEEEKKRQKIIRSFEENLEEIRRQHSLELRNLRENLEAEKEVFINNYKKKESAKFIERESQLHQQYKKERDAEIEMIIETLESEASQIQSELTAAGEAKLKKLREKMESELKEMEENETAAKVRLAETKAKLLEKEDFITELHSRLRQMQTELTFFQKSCEEMTSEKGKIKEIIREEFENSINGLLKEKESLEREMAVCKESHAKELMKKEQVNLQSKHEMQKELTRVYSRIKMAVGKKDKIIESLRQENGVISEKCRQLELMLDKQRRNLLLQ